MDKILEMSWFSFILMWAAVFIIDFILAGVAFNKLQDYHKEIHVNYPEKKMCYSGVDGFMTAILFAFETAQTIGYGSRYPMANCPAGIMLTVIHIVVTTLLATLFGGSFLAKFANNSPDAALMFSQKALITRSVRLDPDTGCSNVNSCHQSQWGPLPRDQDCRPN